MLHSIDWSGRFICIKGFRGVGKTTFLLDYLKREYPNDQSALYINLNHFYFTQRSILSFADEFVKKGGRVLLLDQIQKYPNWSKELRECYDRFPSLQIIFTSSPVLRVTGESAHLKGILKVNHLEGLSFREYLNYKTGSHFPVYSISDIIDNHVKISREIISSVRPLAYFEEYLKNGVYPYFIDNISFYSNQLLKNINLALEIDVPYINQIELKYLPKLRKLLYILAVQSPFTPNISKLASDIQTSRATVMNYLRYLKNARLIQLLYSNGDEPDMKKPDFVYMHNTNLLYAIAPGNTEKQNLRKTFFYHQVGYTQQVEGREQADFLINGTLSFIVGDHDTDPVSGSYVAADMIETGRDRKIPLWLFGFLY